MSYYNFRDPVRQKQNGRVNSHAQSGDFGVSYSDTVSFELRINECGS